MPAGLLGASSAECDRSRKDEGQGETEAPVIRSMNRAVAKECLACFDDEKRHGRDGEDHQAIAR